MAAGSDVPGSSDPDPEPDSLAPGADLVAALERVSAARSLDDRSRALLRFAAMLGGRVRRLGARAVAGGRPLADLVLELAPHLPIRNVETLRQHFDGLTGEALAEALVAMAARETAAVGVAGGAVAAAEWAAVPTLAAVPIQIIAETIAVALIEVKLVAELHAAYGVEVSGSGSQRGVSYVVAWSRRRGIDPRNPTRIPVALGLAGRREIAHRLGGRLARNLGTLAPMFVGALVGGRWNRSETRRLGTAVCADLRDRALRS